MTTYFAEAGRVARTMTRIFADALGLSEVHALSLLGQDLARTEKFTTSMLDGLDIR